MLKSLLMKVTLVSLFIPFRLSETSLEVWMQTRSEDGPLDGFLEFPGGKIEPNESMRSAAIRELKEETGVKALEHRNVEAFKNYSHEYCDRKVSLFTFIGQVQPQELEEDGWLSIDKASPLIGIEDKVLKANQEIISDLSCYFYEILENKSWRELWPPL